MRHRLEKYKQSVGGYGMAVLSKYDVATGVCGHISRFSKDTRAATSVELALVLLPFLALLGATVDTAMLYFRATQLQIVTENVGRMLFINGVERSKEDSKWSDLDHQQFIAKYVCTWQKTGVVEKGTLSKMFDCSKLVMSVQTRAFWRSANMDDDFKVVPQTGRFWVPPENSVAVLRIAYPVNWFFKFLRPSTSSIAQSAGTTQIVVGIFAARVEPAG